MKHTYNAFEWFHGSNKLRENDIEAIKKRRVKSPFHGLWELQLAGSPGFPEEDFAAAPASRHGQSAPILLLLLRVCGSFEDTSIFKFGEFIKQL